ncbi:MAG: Crp/Fnr family transcriptional regulator [Bacteroidia bacterium]|jgi:CRP-like cAMP-binding protein|nr:Crp/Fnr family transcriptional regulator [Bacteroidia bacterium]MCO5269478.1 Crp/Fnr family transcriptional regulator [Brumimicrobium sp.]MCO6461909.1 Crp/Fnr family transcriptional regulator [Saprospiraceae bacterium]
MLKKYFNSHSFLKMEEIESALPLFKEVQLNKGEYFITDTIICNQIAFVVKGSFRGFVVDDKGNEVNICLKLENQFITSYESFLNQQPSKKNIQAMEKCDLLIINRDSLINLLDKFPSFNFLIKAVAEQELIEKENFLIHLNNKSGKEKYLFILNYYPDFIRRVKLSDLASFIGVTPRTVSRIRKNLSGN